MKIVYQPIGFVHSPFTDTHGMPIQPSRAGGVRGSVVVEAQFIPALADLRGFSHIILLCHLHRAKPYRPRVVPYLDDVERGLFATRSPSRPNPIGLSIVRLVGIEGATLQLADLDLLDGTPVLDIKPFVDDFDQRPGARFGWLESARRRERSADRRFET